MKYGRRISSTTTRLIRIDADWLRNPVSCDSSTLRDCYNNLQVHQTFLKELEISANYKMGGSESKEEVIITQATSGDATSSHSSTQDEIISRKDIMVIMIAVTLTFLIQYIYRRCITRLEGKVKKQIIIQSLRKSVEDVANSPV